MYTTNRDVNKTIAFIMENLKKRIIQSDTVEITDIFETPICSIETSLIRTKILKH